MTATMLPMPTVLGPLTAREAQVLVFAVGAAGPQPLAALVCEPCGRSWPSEEELLDHWVDDHEEMP